MILKSTKDVSTNGIKMLVYGQAGTGKTRLCATAPKPVILSAESGLLSLRQFDIPYIEISDMNTLMEAYNYVVESDFQTICLDSISEIAEVCLADEKAKNKDPRQAYSQMQGTMEKVIRAFRDIPNKNIYFSAKIVYDQDDKKRMIHQPSMPGTKLGPNLSYFFDEVFAYRVERNQEGALIRTLQTFDDDMYIAKDRSGRLEGFVEPNITKIMEAING